MHASPPERIIKQPKSPSDWEEPQIYRKDQMGAAVAEDGIDFGTYHAMQHRPILRASVEHDGRVHTGTKACDLMDRLYAANDITDEMRDAGKEYKNLFDTAQLNPLRAMPMDGMPRGGGVFKNVDEITAVHDARKSLAKKHHLLGGAGSDLAEIMWAVVGLEYDLTNRSMSPTIRTTRKANLISALKQLVKIRNGHFEKKY